jgi:hypothetical protein
MRLTAQATIVAASMFRRVGDDEFVRISGP